MGAETNQSNMRHDRRRNVHYRANSGDAVYGLGVIGAAIFYIGQATTFWLGALGLLKAFVWPVLLVMEALKVLT